MITEVRFRSITDLPFPSTAVLSVTICARCMSIPTLRRSRSRYLLSSFGHGVNLLFPVLSLLKLVFTSCQHLILLIGQEPIVGFAVAEEKVLGLLD